jgi:hypothetical protein
MKSQGPFLISQSIDRVLRFLVVTPEMHRLHHSVIIRETQKSHFSLKIFGIIISISGEVLFHYYGNSHWMINAG